MIPTGASSIPARMLNAGVTMKSRYACSSSSSPDSSRPSTSACSSSSSPMKRRRSLKLWLNSRTKRWKSSDRVFVLGPVEMKVHVAGDRSGLGRRRRFRTRLCWCGHGLPLRSRPVRRAPLALRRPPLPVRRSAHPAPEAAARAPQSVLRAALAAFEGVRGVAGQVQGPPAPKPPGEEQMRRSQETRRTESQKPLRHLVF